MNLFLLNRNANSSVTNQLKHFNSSYTSYIFNIIEYMYVIVLCTFKGTQKCVPYIVYISVSKHIIYFIKIIHLV